MTLSAEPDAAPAGIALHGAQRLSYVEIDGYNCELSDDRGFVGDHASGRAFRAILDSTREILRNDGEDPLGDVASAQISKKRLDRLLAEGDIRAAGVVLGAIE